MENPLLFYARRIVECVRTYTWAAYYYVWLNRLRRRIERNPRAANYTDAAISVLVPAETPTGRSCPNIKGFDAARAHDPAWQQAFKENRARQNETALEMLNHKGRERG